MIGNPSPPSLGFLENRHVGKLQIRKSRTESPQTSRKCAANLGPKKATTEKLRDALISILKKK
jgi:hypothetical protein